MKYRIVKDFPLIKKEDAIIYPRNENLFLIENKSDDRQQWAFSKDEMDALVEGGWIEEFVQKTIWMIRVEPKSGIYHKEWFDTKEDALEYAKKYYTTRKCEIIKLIEAENE